MRTRRSPAVFNQRTEPTDSLDDFPTPPWATRALVEHVLKPRRLYERSHLVWEPACNRGIMSGVLREYWPRMIASDIHAYPDFRSSPLPIIEDFLNPHWPDSAIAVDWIITNPPFRLSCDFALQAFSFARCGVAMFCRLNWIEGQERANRLFIPRPPAFVARFAERVPLGKGGWYPDNETATAYAWFVWLAPYAQERIELVLIPGGLRQGLEHPTDRRLYATLRDAPLLEALA